MKKLTSNDIRQAFLTYFKKNGHEIVPSSSLIPANDPTLLFTNAGMVQFKDVFLGSEKKPYKRAVSSQCCVRAGGKHNDLENVGYTARHHTFFEMLGNFSFGDYFKREAIQFAWDFLTNTLQLPKEKLWITVFENDDEAANIWLNEIKINPERFSRCGEKDNFWSMGPTGPCGPCTEIFYDHGESIPGGPPGSKDADLDRYIEIWNVVFMQYDRSADGTLTPLPKPSVDTGMGLERVSAIMQGVHNNYDTDLFKPLIQYAAKLAGMKDTTHFSLRVIADHIRSCSFLILDGITPSNEGRGYVLRRIIRRALRHGNQLGLSLPFFYQLIDPLITVMGSAYPRLSTERNHIQSVLKQEEEQFDITLSQGMKHFEQVVSALTSNIIPGEAVFKLYDTYGFPVDLTADIARERQLTIDEKGFEIAMNAQRDRSRKASHFTADHVTVDHTNQPTEFTGHSKSSMDTSPESATITAIYLDGKFTQTLNTKEKATIVLNRTPFYAESGGQVGDQGVLRINDHTYFKVHDTIKQGHMHLHLGKLDKGTLKVGDEVSAEIDAKRRTATVLNHTATHILHKVLREILGDGATQKGSLVEPDRLRFDFAHGKALTPEEKTLIEDKVNQAIRANHKATVTVTTPDEAIKSGAVALFGEKYGAEVRVVRFGQSVELCGGTHADHTGEIGLFKLTNESGVAAGIRRIEAVTGNAALKHIEKIQQEATEQLKEADDKIRSLEKQLVQLQTKLSKAATDELAAEAKKIGDVFVLAKIVSDLDGKALRHVIDDLKARLKSAVIILAVVKNEKISVVGGVTENLLAQHNARDILESVTKQIGGKSGGRAELAEGGGNKVEALEKALADVYTRFK